MGSGGFDGFDVAAEALADLVFLGRDPLAVGEQRLVLAQVHQHVRPVKPPHGAADDVSDAVLELSVDERLFGPANLHHQGLFRVLGRDAAEADGGDFHLQLFADLGVGLHPPGIEQRKLVVLGYDLLRNHQLGKRADIAVLLVNRHSQLPGRADRLLRRRQQRLLYSTDQDIPLDALLTLPKLQYG